MSGVLSSLLLLLFTSLALSQSSQPETQETREISSSKEQHSARFNIYLMLPILIWNSKKYFIQEIFYSCPRLVCRYQDDRVDDEEEIWTITSFFVSNEPLHCRRKDQSHTLLFPWSSCSHYQHREKYLFHRELKLTASLLAIIWSLCQWW